MKKCHCGKPLHYTDQTVENYVFDMVSRLGEFVKITTPTGTWLVQRHYLALHGIKATDLPSLGFEQIREDT